MRSLLLTLLLCAPVLAQTAAPTTGPAAATPDKPSRSAEDILTAMRAVPPPQIDQSKMDDPAYRPTLEAEIKKYRMAMAPLRDEILQNFPDHPLAARFVQSWIVEQAGDKRDFAKGAQAALDYAKAHPKTQAGTAATMLRVQMLFMQPGLTFAQGRQALDEAIATAGKNEETDAMEVDLITAASDYNPQQKIAAYNKLLAGNPSNVEDIQARIKLAKAVGKPFELAFKDFTTGKDISIKDYKGKVVVIDFWATWCGPCIAELPELKEIYERLRPKGLEIVGVSLDQPEAEGGRTSLTEFLAQEKLPWPNYYQGNGWESAFSKSWGVMAIPRMFVVDQNGNLYSTDAQGKIEEIFNTLQSSGTSKAQ